MLMKSLSILVSGLILIQSLDISFDDIAQLDELLEHANFHSEKYGDSIFVFISKHYGDLKEQHHKDHQEEEKDHQELPFQKHCTYSSITAIVMDTSSIDLSSLSILENSEASYEYQVPISSPHTKGLLQPPQFA